MKQAWARWVLVVCNGLIAMAFGALAVMALSAASDHHIGGTNRAFVLIPLLALGGMLASLAYKQSQRRGRVFQTVVAAIALFISMSGSLWPATVYGLFALLTVWWLGDFMNEDEPEPLTGTPDHIARVMWRRGQSDAVIRAELSARNVPADEIEKLVYELAVEEELRQRMSPGR